MLKDFLDSGVLFWFRREREELRLHVDFAEARDAAGELEEGLHAFEDAHVCEADLLPVC
jgi:hypothetical protein